AIDRFVLARLGEHDLRPRAETDRVALIRRVTFDLIGLPPTPAEVADFVADPRIDAYERVVDRLLASPHFGERWGRHWLDVVRFGETNGYETNTPRPNAWPYRDWVIAACNDDLPFNEFVLAQLAGDQTGQDAATGFLVGGTHDTVGNLTPDGQLQQRQNDLNDMVSTTGLAFLGLTVGCGRCHDHKFDAVTQLDYYRLQAVFAGVNHGERALRDEDYRRREREEPQLRAQIATIDRQLAEFEPLADPQAPADRPPRRAAVDARHNVERFAPIVARRLRFTIVAANQSEPCLDELEVFTAEAQPRNVALASAGAKATSSSDFQGVAIHRLAHVNDGQYGNDHSWICGGPSGYIEIEWSEPVPIERVEWARDREGRFADRLPVDYRIEASDDGQTWTLVAASNDRSSLALAGAAATSEQPPRNDLAPEQLARLTELRQRRGELVAGLPTAGGTPVYAGTFSQPEPTRWLRRGNPLEPQAEVPPGAIESVSPALSLPADLTEAQRRVALARWLCDPANPLTARVAVNRLWMHHFGRGLVDTPNDFGFNGGRPTHPELLDWLATELVDGGWRLKRLHRMMVLSSAYRQASQPDARALTIDADNRWLWRYAPRRLEAEAIRDAILAVSGKLDTRMGGPGYEVFEPNDKYVHVYIPRKQFGPDAWRRMVYQFKPRMQQDATFGELDCPDASQSIGRRLQSTTALQALNLLNGPLIVQQAEFFAERAAGLAGHATEQQVDTAFLLALNRAPVGAERAESVELVEQHGLVQLCRVLFNANEFLHVR
ncbi:MAG: DUF1553 domain-containing protein, partial [Pirellulales bacterium]|nr:DUF1553 domain-containing protein [Pirellulales bacterium]